MPQEGNLPFRETSAGTWAARILLGALLAIATFAVKDVRDNSAATAAQAGENRERITALETSDVDVLRRLERIEDKIDVLVDRRSVVVYRDRPAKPTPKPTREDVLNGLAPVEPSK